MAFDDYMTLELRRAELVFGFVSPLGTPIDAVEATLRARLADHGYTLADSVRISKLLEQREKLDEDLGLEQRQERLMELGNQLREKHDQDILALMAAADIRGRRDRQQPAARAQTAYLIRSLKHPAEVQRLRAIYGKGFFLIGVGASRPSRDKFLRERGFPPEEADRLLDKDGGEDSECGQQTRETFHLADAYISMGRGSGEGLEHLKRIVDLLLSYPFLPPTRDEHAMFMAYAASLRSADLSRHVGAVVLNTRGDIIGVGANDAPAPEGGPYWPIAEDFRPDPDPDGGPDYVRGFDSNERERDKILANVIQAILPEEAARDPGQLVAEYRDRLRHTGIMDLTEFGRAVHAEMSALLACARSGASPAGGTLFCTTFPCHNCTKHIVEAGIVRVVYVEPYPRSKALELHNDAIVLHDDAPHAVNDDQRVRRVTYEPFTGVGARRFFDLFSLTIGSGRPVKRKAKGASGQRLDWVLKEHSAPRVPLDPNSYLDREQAAAKKLDTLGPDRGNVAAPAAEHKGEPDG